MTTNEIMDAVEKVAEYAKKLGLSPYLFYVDDDNCDECISDPSEIIEEPITIKFQVGLTLSHNVYYKGVEKLDELEIVESSKEEYERECLP